MDQFREQKAFLAQQQETQPFGLNTTEWWVLRRFLHPDNPCEPDRRPFINRAAAAYADLHGIGVEAARWEVTKALPSGLKKLKSAMAAKVAEPEPRRLGADRIKQRQQKAPYWAGLD
jgi:hypothetical protein